MGQVHTVWRPEMVIDKPAPAQLADREENRATNVEKGAVPPLLTSNFKDRKHATPASLAWNNPVFFFTDRNVAAPTELGPLSLMPSAQTACGLPSYYALLLSTTRLRRDDEALHSTASS